MQTKLINFNKYSSIKIGPSIEVKIAQNINEAMDLYNDKYYLIGKANNLLLNPKVNKIFQLGKEFDYINECEEYIEVGARSASRKVFLYFKERDFKGAEFLGNLPGFIGGLTKMNAGMKQYEMKDIIQSVCINGKWEYNINFSYRNSDIFGVISAVRFKKDKGFDKDLESNFKTMRSNQPKEPSCGSCFKNPSINLTSDFINKILPNEKSISAGKLLDLAGLKGYKIGNMAFSNIHANFLINLGGGTYKEAMELIDLAKSKVLESFQIKLETEIIIL